MDQLEHSFEARTGSRIRIVIGGIAHDLHITRVDGAMYYFTTAMRAGSIRTSGGRIVTIKIGLVTHTAEHIESVEVID